MHKLMVVLVVWLVVGRAEAKSCRHRDTWRECHFMTLSELEHEDSDSERAKFKLVSIDISDARPLVTPRAYAAVWVKDKANTKQIRQFDISWSVVTSMIEQYKQEFGAIAVSSADGEHFALVLENGGPGFTLYWETTAKAFDEQNPRQRKDNRKLIWVKAFGQPAQYLGVWRGAHGFFVSAPDLAKVLGALLGSVKGTDWLKHDRMLELEPGHKNYTLSGFRLPDGHRTYLSKSGAEVGTHCITMFPYRDAPAFEDLAAVVLIDTDVNLSGLADDLYDLFREVDAARAWPDKDLFPELHIPTYKDTAR